MADLLQSPVTSCAPEPEPTSVLSVSAPLAVIDRELLHFFSSGQASEADSHLHIKQLFESVDEAEIPFLSTSAIKSGSLPVNSLVRYRCLVQDMLDIEYYSGVYRTQKGELLFSKYRDRITSSLFSNDVIEHMYDSLEEVGVIGERLPLVCVPVPGENIWTNSVRGFPSAFTNHIECDDDRDASDVNTKKRRMRRTEGNIGESIGGMDDIPACLLKVYDNMSEPLPTINSDTAQCTGRAVRLNDMIEVVGIYTADDTLELKGSGGMPPMAQGIGLDQSVEEMLLAEEDKLDDQFGESSGEPADVRQERLYPVKLFPRIHCLRFRVLPSTHPLSNYAEVDKAGHCRAHAHVVDTLETVLLGDRLAAEYATLMLLARSNINAAQQQNVEECHNYGNLCLNLCNAINHIDSTTDIRVERLNTFLRELLPRSILLEVNVDSLNAAPMFVCKSASGGRTEPSQLQVGGGTTIVLDETNMGEGVLDGCGLKNIKTLKGFLSEQKLLVECNYYDIHIPTDVAVITFSKANSILSTSGTIHVPLRQVDSSPMDCTNEIDLPSSDSDMQVMREWWARCRHLPRPQMDEAVVQAAERDFLAARGRSTDPEAVSSAVLHRWILTAQLVALAQNAPVLTIEHWEKMQSLEHQVKQRLVPGNV